MTRNLKALGLALLAAFALSAVAASAASAEDRFTSNSSTEATDLTGETTEGVPKLTAAGFTVECEKGTYAGTVDGNDVNEITVHPTYHGFATKHEGDCYVGVLDETARVDTHGCDYILTGETDESDDAAVYIECTGEKEITIKTTEFGVTFHIPPQGPLYGVSYTEIGETITVDATVEGIEYTCSGALCFLLPNNGNGSEGGYTDDVLTSGYQDEETFDMDEETHTWSGTHGSKVDLGLHEE